MKRSFHAPRSPRSTALKRASAIGLCSVSALLSACGGQEGDASSMPIVVIPGGSTPTPSPTSSPTPTPTPTPTQTGRTEVPIQTQTLPDGVTRYAIPITVGGRSVLAGLDTGSYGLRLLPAAQIGLPPTDNSPPVDFSFAKGVQLTGPIVRGQIAIGSRTGSIDVQKVTAVGCTTEAPDCPAKGTKVDDFRILANGYTGENGFVAIIGIRPRLTSTPVNPLIQLGVHRWIVSLPQVPGATGTLVLAPSDSDVAGFTRVPSGRLPGRVLGCLSTPAATAGPACGETDIDTGTASITVHDRRFPNNVPQNAPAQFVFGVQGAVSPAIALLLNNQAQVSTYRKAPPDDTPPMVIGMGVTPYLTYDILYDADRGTMAVRARVPFAGGPLARP